MLEINWSEKVKEALSRTKFMAVSTTGADGVWVNPVEYFYNENLNFYFASMTNAQHSKNIIENGDVALAIYKTERFPGPGDHVMGLQIKGKGKLLKEKMEIEEATRSDCKTKNDFSEFDSILAERLSPDCVWHYFKVETTEMWLFDSRDFEDVRQKVNFQEIKF